MAEIFYQPIADSLNHLGIQRSFTGPPVSKRGPVYFTEDPEIIG